MYRYLSYYSGFAHPREYTHIWNICTRIIGGRYMRRPFTPAHSYLLSTSSASLSTLFSFLSYELGSERSSTSRTLREGAIDIYRMLSHDDHRYDRELCFAIVLRPSPRPTSNDHHQSLSPNRTLGSPTRVRWQHAIHRGTDRRLCSRRSRYDRRTRISCASRSCPTSGR